MEFIQCSLPIIKPKQQDLLSSYRTQQLHVIIVIQSVLNSGYFDTRTLYIENYKWSYGLELDVSKIFFFFFFLIYIICFVYLYKILPYTSCFVWSWSKFHYCRWHINSPFNPRYLITSFFFNYLFFFHCLYARKVLMGFEFLIFFP